MKKIILIISILFLLLSVFSTNIFAIDGVVLNSGNYTTNTNKNANTNTPNLIGDKIENKNTNNTNSTNNTNKVNNTNNTNTTNKINTTNKTNSSYKNTNLPDTGSEDFVYGFIIVVGIASAVYAYIKIKMYNI